MTDSPPPEPTTLASWARSIWRVMQAEGMDAQAVFTAAGLDPAIMAQGDGRYPVRAMTPLWQALHAVLGDGIGLRVGQSMHWRDMQAVGLAFLSSRDVGQAVERAQRYGTLISDALDIGLEVDGGLMALRVGYRLEDELPLLAERLEAILAIILRISNNLLDYPLVPHHIELSRARPDDPAPWHACFGEHIVWAAPRLRLLVNPADLTQPPPMLDPQVGASHEQLLRDMFTRRTLDVPLHRVRQVIRELLELRAPALEDVAERLSMSARSLQRLLARHQSSFSAEVDAARHSLAMQYLGQGMAPGKVAYALGYLEPSSFYKAFRRWTGGTPGQQARQDSAGVSGQDAGTSSD